MIAQSQNNTAVWAIILASGIGSRIGAVCEGVPKQFLPYKGEPLYMKSITTFMALPYIAGIIIVLPTSYIEQEREYITKYSRRKGIPCIPVVGGSIRSHSMQAGVNALPQQCSYVYIHDAARPFFSAKLAQTLYSTVQAEDNIQGVIPVLPLVDTIKHIQNMVVLETPTRANYVRAQTPQLLSTTALRSSIEMNKEYLECCTDDASLLEHAGYTVRTIEGEECNIKITHPHDMDLLKPEKHTVYKTVMGYDVHAYVAEGRSFVLGGVHIPSPIQIQAHSDGDVLLHALIDAVLALTPNGDIGACFPDSDEKYDGIASSVLLDIALDILHATTETTITHIDATIVAQAPLIAPHVKAIKKNIAYLTSLEEHAVSIKATTEEKLGFTGAKKGIKAYIILSAMVKI